MDNSKSIDFFDRQFSQPLTEAALRLNPFEALALPYLQGDVLDYGCGMGNLAFAAAARGCRVSALDASRAAVEHVRQRAAAQGAAVSATLADLRDHPLAGDFNAIVAIGLLMFFDCPTAQRVLAQLQARVRPGGVAAVNILVQGTTYLAMFDAAQHCLLAPAELAGHFDGWEILQSHTSDFEAPGQTLKRFETVVARKPCTLPGRVGEN